MSEAHYPRREDGNRNSPGILDWQNRTQLMTELDLVTSGHILARYQSILHPGTHG
jgi:hypothetical protein